MVKEFRLSYEACDKITEGIVEFCHKQHVDRKDTLRYRLSAEECLLNWIEKGCEGRRIKPMTAAYDLVLVMYFASIYHVQCSPVWLLLAVFICIIVAVSTPPIPGGGTIAYTILFAQLGIPKEAMALALTLDIIVDFLLTSFDMFALQMAIINISARMGRLDRAVLRRSDN